MLQRTRSATRVAPDGARAWGFCFRSSHYTFMRYKILDDWAVNDYVAFLFGSQNINAVKVRKAIANTHSALGQEFKQGSFAF